MPKSTSIGWTNVLTVPPPVMDRQEAHHSMAVALRVTGRGAMVLHMMVHHITLHRMEAQVMTAHPEADRRSMGPLEMDRHLNVVMGRRQNDVMLQRFRI